MRSLHRLFWFCLALPAGLSCGFPDATFTERSSTGVAGGSGTTESGSTGAAPSDAAGSGGAVTSGDGGNGGGSASSGGAWAGSGGGSTGYGGGSTGYGGGSATSSASAGPATSGSGGGSATSGSGGGSATSSSATSGSGGGTVDCDADKDGYLSIACEGGDDCNDGNPLVHPNQPSTFYDTPIPPGRSFDYDCSGEEEAEFRSITCSGLVCTAGNSVFLTEVACGNRGPFGSCSALCMSKYTFNDYIRACH
ncbi:hypothetical protein WME90_29880 [Sorangium sp. So ce375]|uniref:hypothetical protein n=1 Tax=Sorangium sp. So ce375 TaxID=3133306 RepID=UPI003F5B1B92